MARTSAAAVAESQDIIILHLFEPSDSVAAAVVATYLEESGRRHDFSQGRSMVFHRAHVPKAKDHLHFFLKGNQIYSLNRDGTAHDNSRGAQMHRWAMDAIKQKYPDFATPPKGVIESSLLTADTLFLVEAYVAGQPVVTKREIRRALNWATLGT